MRHPGLRLFVTLVLTVGMVQQAPAGRRVTIDGNRGMWLTCIGTGRPTVLLEAGHADSSATWQRVQARLGPITRVCGYDRAGRGRSDPPPSGPRLGRDVVQDLHGLLGAASEPGPYVLVGHSLGGAFVRLYATSYPGEVAAIVLVDAVHEGEFAAIDTLLTPEQRSAGAGMRPFSPEGIDIEGVYQELAASKRPLLMPVVVVARGRPLGAEEMPPDWTAEQRRRREDLRVALQADLAALSADSELLVANRSGHFVHHEEPSVVVDAVRRLVERWRRANLPFPRSEVPRRGPLRGSLEPRLLEVGASIVLGSGAPTSRP